MFTCFKKDTSLYHCALVQCTTVNAASNQFDITQTIYRKDSAPTVDDFITNNTFLDSSKGFKTIAVYTEIFNQVLKQSDSTTNTLEAPTVGDNDGWISKKSETRAIAGNKSECTAKIQLT